MERYISLEIYVVWPGHTADISGVMQQTCLLCHTADMSAVSHSRHVCCVTQQTCLLCHTADMSAVSHSRHVCCVTQQTCLLCHTADMLSCRIRNLQRTLMSVYVNTFLHICLYRHVSHSKLVCLAAHHACRHHTGQGPSGDLRVYIDMHIHVYVCVHISLHRYICMCAYVAHTREISFQESFEAAKKTLRVIESCIRILRARAGAKGCQTALSIWNGPHKELLAEAPVITVRCSAWLCDLLWGFRWTC